MALLHRATMVPTKPELLAAWLPSQAWAADLPGLRPFGGYRIDDPAGEVGLEGILLRSEDGSVVHAPLTYRSAPLQGSDAHLIGTTEHSVLGTRWVYDAVGDPVWHAAVAAVAVTGDPGAEEYFEVDGRREVREPRVRVVGSGAAGSVVPADAEVVVVRHVGDASDPQDGADPVAVLTGAWEGGSGVLVVVRIAG